MKNNSVFKFLLKSTLLLVLIFFGINISTKIFYKEKNFGYKSWTSFYQKKKNSLDIMMFGSSHLCMGLSGNIVEAVLGTKVYTVSSPGQTIYESYFNIKEALKYQNPKLIIVETYSFQDQNISIKNFKNIDSGATYQNKLSSYRTKKLGLNKFDETLNLYKNDISVLFNYLEDHNNWSDVELISANAKSLFDNKKDLYYKGNRNPHRVMNKDKVDKYKSTQIIKSNSKIFEINPDEIEYIKKINTLCKERNIDLLFITIPVYNEFLKKIKVNYQNNKVKLMALLESEKINFIDFNEINANLDYTYFTDDKVGRNQHLNYKGAIKSSLDLTNFLKKNYPYLDSSTKNDKSLPEHLIYNNKLNDNPNDQFKAYVGKINKSLDKSVSANQKLVINGWMIVDGENSSETEKFVCLVNDEFKYINLQNQIKVNILRKEVSKRYNVEDLYDKSGFRVIINTKLLEKGDYDLILATRDKRGIVRTKKTSRKIIID